MFKINYLQYSKQKDYYLNKKSKRHINKVSQSEIERIVESVNIYLNTNSFP